MNSRRTKKVKDVSALSDSEPDSRAESEFEVQEGINDLMNLPIELLRKELISRKFQPSVINALPHWQLSAMLRESTTTSSDSFFAKILGYTTYWSSRSKPAFTKQSFDELQQNEFAESKAEEEEEEPDIADVDVSANEFSKRKQRRKHVQNTDSDNDDFEIDPDNYILKYFNNQYRFYPKTLITDIIPKRAVPPEYKSLQEEQFTNMPISTESSTKKDDNDIKLRIIDDPDLIPSDINTALLNFGVLQSSIDNLTPEQIKKIREESKLEGFDAHNLISEYNLQIAKSKFVNDSQFSDSQIQNSEDSDKATNSSSSSSDDDDDDDDSDSNNSKKSSDDENDEVDDHMNVRY